MVSLSDQNERDVQPPNVTTTCTENHLIHSESLLGYTENHLIHSESLLGYTFYTKTFVLNDQPPTESDGNDK